MKAYQVGMAMIYSLVAAACATIGTTPVSFVSEPQTPDEKAVAQTLQSLITSFNEHDLTTLVSHFAPDATIDSLVAGAGVTREKFHQDLQASPDVPYSKVDLRQAKIMGRSQDQSRVEGVLYVLGGSRGISSHRIVYDLVRREGQWLIIKHRYPELY